MRDFIKPFPLINQIRKKGMPLHIIHTIELLKEVNSVSFSLSFNTFILLTLISYSIHSYLIFAIRICMFFFASSESSSHLCFNIRDQYHCQQYWMSLALKFQHLCFSNKSPFTHINPCMQYRGFKDDTLNGDVYKYIASDMDLSLFLTN